MENCAFSRRRFLAVAGVALGVGIVQLANATPIARALKHRARSLRLFHTHTGEQIRIVYWEPHGYLKEALDDISYFLRDYHTGAVHSIDPSLLDLLHDLSAVLDPSAPFHVLSGYRCPATNARLVKRLGAARHSLHTEGKAIDLHLPGRKLSTVRKAACAINSGGVGYYPRRNFVHLDVGPARQWSHTTFKL